MTLQFLSDYTKLDRNIAIETIKSDTDAHKYDVLEDDKEIVTACLKNGAFLSRYKEFWNDKDGILAGGGNGFYDEGIRTIYNELSNELKTDKQIS